MTATMTDWRTVMAERYPCTDRADDAEESCEHSSVRCTRCGSINDECNGDHSGDCPHGCDHCKFDHPCEDCGHEEQCSHRWQCASPDCGENDVNID